MRHDVSFAPRGSGPSPVLGGFAALVYPTVLVVVALGVGFRRGGDMGDFAATLAATVLFLIAAPTAWVLAFPFIEVTRFTVLVFGIVTSAPLWYLVGVAIARRSPDWIGYAVRYTVFGVAWTACNLVILGIVAGLTG